MKIVQLIAENFKRLKAIQIVPKENCILITGKNEQGKSSVLDCIWMALEYAEANKENPMPVRQGEAKGFACIDLGDYIVTRRFTADGGTTLQIETPIGDKVSSPQKLLDGLIGKLSFDPLAFSRLKEVEQRQVLLDILGIDLDKFDIEYKKVYGERSELNKEKKRLEGMIQGITPPTDKDPMAEISATELIKTIQEEKENLAQLRARIKRIEEIDLLIQKLQEERNNLSKIESNSKYNIPTLEEKLRDLEVNNRRAREVQQYKSIQVELEKVNSLVDKLNNKLELIKIEKDEALEKNPLPIDGLEITPDGVLFKQIPFQQLSSAIKTRIALAIAMAANPKLRVIRIMDGSLLDSESMKIIEEMAIANDFQIWIEKVDESGKCGIVIEDGGIKYDGT